MELRTHVRAEVTSGQEADARAVLAELAPAQPPAWTHRPGTPMGRLEIIFPGGVVDLVEARLAEIGTRGVKFRVTAGR